MLSNGCSDNKVAVNQFDSDSCFHSSAVSYRQWVRLLAFLFTSTMDHRLCIKLLQ